MLDDNMMSIYGIIIGDWYESEEYLLLTKGILGILTAQINNAEDIGNQLENDVYQYINNYAVDTSNVMPSGGGKNSMLMSNRIVLIADTEVAQGAVLKIEYKMPIRPNARYGTGNIGSLKIVDKKNSQLAFSRDERLITDSSKTNADYGWNMEKDELVTTKKMSEARLVLSVLLSAKQLEDVVYDNSATCYISFDVGSDSIANYTRSATAMEVQVLPPFGKEENYTGWICITIGAITSITILSVIAMINKKDRREKNGL